MIKELPTTKTKIQPNVTYVFLFVYCKLPHNNPQGQMTINYYIQYTSYSVERNKKKNHNTKDNLNISNVDRMSKS